MEKSAIIEHLATFRIADLIKKWPKEDSGHAGHAMRALQYEVSRCQVERAIQQQREISDLVAVHVGFDKRVAA